MAPGKKSEMEILRMMDGFVMRATHGVQLMDRKKPKNSMLMLGLNETIDQLSVEDSVCCYGDHLRWENGHVLGKVLGLNDEGQKGG